MLDSKRGQEGSFIYLQASSLAGEFLTNFLHYTRKIPFLTLY